MEPINAPDEPVFGQEHIEGSIRYRWNGQSWQVMDKREEDSRIPDIKPLPQDGKPDVATKSTDQFGRSIEKNLSYDEAVKLLSTYKVKNPEIYNSYVQSLKNLGYITSKKPSYTTIQSAWKKALIDAGNNQITIDDLILSGVGEPEPGTGDSKTNANRYRSYLRSIQRSSVIQGVKLSKGDAEKLARQGLSEGWDASTINEEVSRTGKISGDQGTAATTKNALKQLVGEYGLQYSEQWYDSAVEKILTGQQSIETYKNEVIQRAKEVFPTFAQDIDNGFSVMQKGDRFLTTYRNLTGIDTDLYNPIIRKAMVYQDPEGNSRALADWELEELIRKEDPNWRKGPDAQERTTSMIRAVSQMWGAGF
jgi:hypothetical protein